MPRAFHFIERQICYPLLCHVFMWAILNLINIEQCDELSLQLFPASGMGLHPTIFVQTVKFGPPNPAGHLAGLWNAYIGIFLKHEWLKFKCQEWRGDPRGSEPPPHYLEGLSERCMPPPREATANAFWKHYKNQENVSIDHRCIVQLPFLDLIRFLVFQSWSLGALSAYYPWLRICWHSF